MNQQEGWRPKRATVPHLHYPLSVAGVLRSTCSCHFWLPIVQPDTPRLAVVR